MNYGELKTAVQDTVHRTDGNVATFIALAHSRIVNDLDVPEYRKFAVIDTDQSVPVIGAIQESFLPANTLKVLGVVCNGVRLEPLPPQQLQDMYQRGGGGVAYNYSIVGNKLWTGPGLGEITMTYQERMAELAADADTNPVLTNYPGVYLYASAAEFHQWAQDTEQLQICTDMYDSQVRMARAQYDRLNFGGTPRMQAPQHGARQTRGQL